MGKVAEALIEMARLLGGITGDDTLDKEITVSTQKQMSMNLQPIPLRRRWHLSEGDGIYVHRSSRGVHACLKENNHATVICHLIWRSATSYGDF